MNSDITGKVTEIISNIKKCELDFIIKNVNKPLTGRDIGLDAIQMTYLILEIMDEFSIEFNKKDLEYYKFNSISNIVQIIESKTIN